MEKDLFQPLPDCVSTLLVNVLVPNENGTYSRNDIALTDGIISQIAQGNALNPNTSEFEEVIDCSEKMILPGFVNAHTHSIEHWAKGLIKPLPLELWVLQLIRHEPRGERGWFGEKSFETTPAWAVGLSALHAGLESILGGCTAILDHLFVRHLEDIEEAVKAYKALGIRAFIAPMLNDDAELYANYIPLVHDAKQRNDKLKLNEQCISGCCSGISDGGMAEDGSFRLRKGKYDSQKTKDMLALWEEAIQKFHDPKGGIEIVIGPVTPYSCSPELLRGATELRKRYNLCGHTHLLETRAQALLAKQFFPSGSAVKHLKEVGFLDSELRGTSFAHTIWLTQEEMDLVAENGGICVHNPLSNLRLGSGVMPVEKAIKSNIKVAMGCDGSCSSDGQDMLEVLKMGTILTTTTNPDYKEWSTPSSFALNMASKNGYAAIGMDGDAGDIKVGMVADLTLWDLTSLALLPRTDPLSLLILGSRTQAPDAGSTLNTAWVRGYKIISNGSPLGVNVAALRRSLMKAEPNYRNPEITDPRTDEKTAGAEREYRAAMGLDIICQEVPTPDELKSFPQNCVLYDSTIP